MTTVEIKQEDYTRDDIIDMAEAIISEGEPVEMPLTHKFTDGMYIRQIDMPAGAVLTSMIHNTNHPFCVIKGKCKVYDGDEVIEIEAPYNGITPANTRRLILIEEDTVWITYHATELTDVDEIEKQIINTEYKNELLNKTKAIENKRISRSINHFEKNKGDKL
jgi:hypothetical protein